MGEEVAALADGSDDIDDLGLAGYRLLQRSDLVVAFVKGGADEIVHRRIDDLEGLRGAALFVEHLGEENARIAHHESAGLEDDAKSERLEEWDEATRVFLDRERLFILGYPPVRATAGETVLVDDADAATDREELDAVERLQLLDER